MSKIKKDVKQIEEVKRRATSTKLIHTIQDIPYQQRLQFMDLPSLVYRRYCGDLIEVSEFIHGICTSGYDLLPRAPRSALRGHEYKLKKRYCRSQLTANFCSFRIVNLWNRLPCEVLSLPSMNTFKHRLDNYWANYCYILDPEDFLRQWTTEQPTGLVCVQDYPGKTVPEETSTHLHLSHTYPDHQPSFINFLCLLQSIASSLFNLCA